MNPDHADANDQRDDEHRISYFEMWKNAAALALKMEAERDQWKQAAELNAADMRSEYARANFLEMELDEATKDARRWEDRAYRVRRVPVNDGRSDSDYWAEIDAEIDKNRIAKGG